MAARIFLCLVTLELWLPDNNSFVVFLLRQKKNLTKYAQDGEFVRFLGRIDNTMNCFRDLLTFSAVFCGDNELFIDYFYLFT